MSYRSLAQKYNIGSDGQIVRWVKLYEKFGIEGLMTKK
ncbi:helix-turn-helix domain-containing protein [Paraliobacillus sediminis]